MAQFGGPWARFSIDFEGFLGPHAGVELGLLSLLHIMLSWLLDARFKGSITEKISQRRRPIFEGPSVDLFLGLLEHLVGLIWVIVGSPDSILGVYYWKK